MMHALILAAGFASAAPCITAAPACTEWVQLAGHTSRLQVYRSYSLSARNEHVTRALVFVHGINRDANNHFRTALAAAFLDGALSDTVIVAPRFASDSSATGNEAGNCGDRLLPNEANWYCENQRPDTWRSGGTEVGNEGLTSFDFMDQIVRQLGDKQLFPKLRSIVIAGHSAGGQFVIRYEMTNKLGDMDGVKISYVVANPSSYPYLDGTRPTPSALPANISASAPGFRPPPPANPPPPFTPFADAGNCTAYDDWPYGLKNRRGYVGRLSANEVMARAASGSVTYLLGESDILPSGIFDVSCPAMAQGPTRLARGLAFARYMNEAYGAHHEVVVVPFCGHNSRCVFTADVAFPSIFPR
jgi:pimeloyl-ACP methyl ester carboxylesterase